MKLISAPKVEPVTLDELKSHARISHDTEDVYLNSLVQSARDWIERVTGRALITQSWLQAWDIDPAVRKRRIARAPLQSITRLQIRYSDDRIEEVDKSAYTTDHDPDEPMILLSRNIVFPNADTARWEIEFTAGYGNDHNMVPGPLRQAVLRLAAGGYEARLTAPTGDVEDLIKPYRRWRL